MKFKGLVKVTSLFRFNTPEVSDEDQARANIETYIDMGNYVEQTEVKILNIEEMGDNEEW